ncbi:uncharacterized protein [Nicotiana sylvestris]|uniref:uncharacterized protein n=1 Tax=Nicotiana sylvestris TaxID=4096 RepID=UPI00388C7E10
MSRDSLDTHVYVFTPIEDSIVVNRVYQSCLVTIGGYETRVDLMLLNMVDYDVILCMDWLSLYYGILDCHAKNAQRIVEKVCLAYLDFVRDVGADTPIVDSVFIVRDFPNIFPTDLPGKPPDRDIDFGIELAHCFIFGYVS